MHKKIYLILLTLGVCIIAIFEVYFAYWTIQKIFTPDWYNRTMLIIFTTLLIISIILAVYVNKINENDETDNEWTELEEDIFNW